MNLLLWATSFPLNIWAIFTVCSQGPNDRAAPFYISLLLADLIQLCCAVLLEISLEWRIFRIVAFIFDFALAVRHCFMLRAALERYLIMTCPRWRKSKRTIKNVVADCVLVWTVPAVSALSFYLWVDFKVLSKVYSVLILLPVPLLMFFLHGIVKALAASSSVPSAEKSRIVGVLVPELLIYSLLFLPRAVGILTHGNTYDDTFHNVSTMLVELGPLADMVLYVFMRKGAKDEHLLLRQTTRRSDSKNDCSIVTVSCRALERTQKEKCGQECFEPQGLCNGVPAAPSNGSSFVTYVLMNPLCVETFAERRA